MYAHLKFLKDKFNESELNLKTSVYEIIKENSDILSDSSIHNFSQGLKLIDDINTDLMSFLEWSNNYFVCEYCGNKSLHKQGIWETLNSDVSFLICEPCYIEGLTSEELDPTIISQ